MLYPIIIFVSFLEAATCFILLSASTMKFREPKLQSITAGVVAMLCSACFYLWIFFGIGKEAAETYGILVILVSTSSWFVICSGDSFFVSLFNYLTDANMFLMINCISDTLAVHVTGVKYQIEYMIIRAVIYAIILPLFFKFIKPRFRRLITELQCEWRVNIVVPFLFFVLQIFLLYYPVMYWYRERYNSYLIIIAYLLFFGVYYMLYIQANAIMEKYALEKRELLMAQQNKLWETELVSQKMAVAEAARQHHDMRHHNAVIIEMLGSGNMDSLKEYMRRYDANLDKYTVTAYCSNPTVNSILNAYSQRAKQENIEVKISASVPQTIEIDSIDLTVVFANALENAIDGCMRLPEGEKRQIAVTVKYIDDRLRVQVENTCQSEITFEDDLPQTQKKGGGTGTRSIVYTAEKYDGMVGFSVKDGKFYTQIVLNAAEIKIEE
ncbi:GHKL domain-containing protein [Oscillospiraceae bacterium PP1C4]